MRRGELLIAACPSREVLKHVTSRWGVQVLLVLETRVHRFSELRRAIGGVSERMLAQTLQWLEADGLVDQRPTRSALLMRVVVFMVITCYMRLDCVSFVPVMFHINSRPLFGAGRLKRTPYPWLARGGTGPHSRSHRRRSRVRAVRAFQVTDDLCWAPFPGAGIAVGWLGQPASRLPVPWWPRIAGIAPSLVPRFR